MFLALLLLLMAIQNIYLIYFQLVIFHFFKKFFSLSLGIVFFWGWGWVISTHLGYKEGPPKKFLRMRRGHHIHVLQEILVKSHQLPLNQTKNEWSLMATPCKDLK